MGDGASVLLVLVEEPMLKRTNDGRVTGELVTFSGETSFGRVTALGKAPVPFPT